MSETKPDLMAELADKWDAMAADARKKGEHGMSNAYEDCAEELRTHHAELEAVVRDAARYRWLRNRLAGADHVSELVGYNHDMYPKLREEVDSEIDHAMHNSAREG